MLSYRSAQHIHPLTRIGLFFRSSQESLDIYPRISLLFIYKYLKKVRGEGNMYPRDYLSLSAYIAKQIIFFIDLLFKIRTESQEWGEVREGTEGKGKI